MDTHQVFLLDPIRNSLHPNNYIETTKYSYLSFIPKSIFFQFLRLANFYFLCTAVVQCIPGLSPINPLTAIGPLVLVLLVAMIKEAIEDLSRRKNDKRVNHSKCLHWQKTWVYTEWRDLIPGDLVKVSNGEDFPADLVLLTSSEETGECKVQTCNLDGETSLKTKLALDMTRRMFSNDVLNETSLSVSVNRPCYGLNVFSGSIQTETQHFLDSKQLLLRGSNLKNTRYIIGMVVYTGHDTKIMMNQKPTPYKRSQFENILNKIVIFQLIIQTGLCLFLAISSVSFENDVDSKGFTFKQYDSDWTQGFVSYFSFFLLLNSLIPISMIVSLELVKFLQTFFVQMDCKMYSQEQDRFAKVLNMSILEELGAIDYIFCDKTGTLTTNIMKFRSCNIAGIEYIDPNSSSFLDRKLDSEHILEEENRIFTLGHSFEFRSDYINEFWQAILLCNEIVIDNSSYLSSSPDEVALIEAASSYNFRFAERTSSGISVKINGSYFFFEVLAINEFSSDRKCMSVLVKDPINNTTKLYIKGADEALTKKQDSFINNPFLSSINDSLKKFSTQGFRSLFIGFKIIENPEDWLARYKEAKCKHGGDQKSQLEELAEEVERGCFILGITAVEDKLQKKVPKAIQEFNSAGVHIWMITGDKLETAENVAFSCSLLKSGWTIYQIRSSKDVLDEIKCINQEILTNKLHNKTAEFGLIIEGDALSVAIEKNKKTFFDICKNAKGVVCCRANPKQKAKIVSFVRKMNPNAKTLAIGDGGNDVTMIQMAHVGVGIFGKEGHQAANSSDFAIAEFRYLRHLLFVHGRWNSRRIGYFILYFFFKNVTFTLVQAYFAFISGFSAQTVWDDWYLLLYNSAITAAGITCYSLWEQDLNYRLDHEVKYFWPVLYKCNREHLPLTVWKYVLYMIWGVYSSLAVYFICSQGFKETLNREGKTEVFWDYSTCMYSSIVIIVAIILIIKMKYWSWIQHLTIWVLGFALYCPLFMLVYDLVPGTYVYANTLDFLSLPVFWACLWLCTGVCTIPFYAVYLNLELFWPLDSDLVYQKKLKIEENLYKDTYH